MPKVITSPVKRFPGTVTLKDPIPLDACVAWEQALVDCSFRPCSGAIAILANVWKNPDKKNDEAFKKYTEHVSECDKCQPAPRETAAQAKMIPAIRACVQEWHIEGFDPENPPGNPRASRSALIGWLIEEIGNLYAAEGLAEKDPNE